MLLGVVRSGLLLVVIADGNVENCCGIHNKKEENWKCWGYALIEFFSSVLDRWQGRCNPDYNTIDIVTVKVMSLHVTLAALFVSISQSVFHLFLGCSHI